MINNFNIVLPSALILLILSCNAEKVREVGANGSAESRSKNTQTTPPAGDDVMGDEESLWETIEEEQEQKIELGKPTFLTPLEGVNTIEDSYMFSWNDSNSNTFYEVKSCQESSCSSDTCNESVLIKDAKFNLNLSYHRDQYLCVRAADGGSEFSPWTVSEKVYKRSLPQDIQIIDFQYDLSTKVGSEVGKLSVSNADPKSVYSFEILPSEMGDTQFSLENSDDDPNYNNILVSQLDVTADMEQSVLVKVSSDHGDEFVKEFTFVVGLENLPPSNIQLTKATLEENQGVGVVVGFLSAEDATPGDFHRFELLEIAGSADDANFEIDGTVLKSSIDFDYEQQSSYTIRIKAIDKAGLSYQKDFQVLITCQTGLKQIGAYCFEDDGVLEVEVFDVTFSGLNFSNATDPQNGEFVDGKFLTGVSPGDTVNINFDWSTAAERPVDQYCPSCIVFFPFGFERELVDGQLELVKLGCVAAGARLPGTNDTINASFQVPAGAEKGVYRMKQFRQRLQYTCDDSPLVASPESRDMGVLIVD